VVDRDSCETSLLVLSRSAVLAPPATRTIATSSRAPHRVERVLLLLQRAREHVVRLRSDGQGGLGGRANSLASIAIGSRGRFAYSSSPLSSHGRSSADRPSIAESTSGCIGLGFLEVATYPGSLIGGAPSNPMCCPVQCYETRRGPTRSRGTTTCLPGSSTASRPYARSSGPSGTTCPRQCHGYLDGATPIHELSEWRSPNQS
jgi:hypothetical protein